MVNLTQKHVGLSRPQSEAAANGLPHPIGRQRSLIIDQVVAACYGLELRSNPDEDVARLCRGLRPRAQTGQAADRFPVVETWLPSQQFPSIGALPYIDLAITISTNNIAVPEQRVPPRTTLYACGRRSKKILSLG